MSAENNVRTGKSAVFSDVYTALLALALAAVLSTSIFVMVKCMSEYGTLFSIAKP